MRLLSLVAMSLVLASCRGGPWTPGPVSCLAPQGRPVPGATVTFHPERADAGDPVVVVARAPGLIGSATIRSDERDQPVTVHVRNAAVIRGRVHTPADWNGRVGVAVVAMQSLFVPRGLERFQVQGFTRTWSMAAQAWLPRIDALDTQTAADGSFELQACADAVQLAFSAPGLASVRCWTSAAGASLDVTMVREARIAVNVRDPGGEPVAGTMVRLSALGPGAPGTEPQTWVRRTAADGNAVFDGLPPGAHLVEVTAAEVAPHLARVDVAAGQTLAVPARMERGVLLRGCIRDGKGDPVQGVRVAAFVGLDPPFAAGSVSTDARGTDRLRLPRRAGALRLSALPDGWRDPLEHHPLDLTRAGRWVERDFGLEPVLQARR